MRHLPSLTAPLRIDLTSMIDVIFLLLIFWMTVTRLAGSTQAAMVDTPVTDSRHARNLTAGSVTIDWVADGEPLLLAGQAMSLDGVIATLIQEPAGRHILLRVNADVEAAKVQALLAKLSSIGIDRVGVAVREVEP